MAGTDILLVEDDASLREALCDTLELAGYSVACAVNGVDALAQLAQNEVRLVLSDVQMDQMDGFALLEHMHSRYGHIPVLLMTAYGTIEKAVQAMQGGACNYLVKPFEAGVLLEQVARYIAEPLDEDEGGAMTRVVEDVAMKQLFALAAKVAASDATVLIQGESGTGKEVLARYIHEASARRDKPFIAINCAAIPENMLEAILFGYEKGAFTGAHQSTPGKFEQAQGGTLLLDEITEMPLALQAKLLRVLQEKEVERLGARKPMALDVRVLATTNRTLTEQVSKGDFREDLYYRLNVFPLTLPPLRERRGDILPLAVGLLQRHWKSGKTLPVLDDEARQRLTAYHWPGNVRELENVMQRAIILQEGGRIGAAAIVFEHPLLSGGGGEAFAPAPAPAADSASPLESGLRSLEEKIILDVLKEECGSRKATAERLGLSERTLRYKIARLREAGVSVPV
ncbi:sigma-54-dependent transcriptional regulator [Methylogaea oryzae]|uniref:Sigma-54-dependent Fis family transcriptional regulator n=2 Tax=Methylogaea oryzae TaxID=1295382 RepID=A0A8D5AJN1_9GAMM|nr:sigma-54 dependent transcriptional regulator [Methylogaea oryzae]BBL70231.1 sigma-54-dependent Fis family transcriptional regulator [Methylogaea oryzae]